MKTKEDVARQNRRILLTPYKRLWNFSTLWSNIREVKHRVYVKRQALICTMWPSFPFTCRLLFIISTHKLVVSRNFLSIRIVLNCFYLLIFYFEKFSTWICRLPYRWRSSLYFRSVLMYHVKFGKFPNYKALFPSVWTCLNQNLKKKGNRGSVYFKENSFS